MDKRVENIIGRYWPLLFGLAVGFALVKVLSGLPLKWGIFLVVGAVLISVLMLIGLFSKHLRGSLLFLAILGLPTFYGNTFSFRDGVTFTVLANGFFVSLTDLLLAPLVVVWLHQLFSDKDYPRPHFPRDWLTVIVLLFLINLVSAMFVARLPFFSFSMLFLQLKMYFIMFFLANYIRTEHDFRLVGYAFAAVLIFEGLVVMEQRFVGVLFTAENLGRSISIKSHIEGGGSMIRNGGTLGHPNDLAMYINLCLPIVTFMLLMERKTVRKVFLVAAILLAMAALIGSGSRGGWLGMGLSFSVGAFFWLRKQGKNPFKGMLIMAVSLALLFAVLFVGSQTFHERLVKGDKEAAEIRIPLMEVAMQMVKEHPVLGVGLNLYTREMVPYDRTNYFVAYSYDQPVHNTFLMIAAECGLPAMILFCVFIFFVFKEAYHVVVRGQGMVFVVGLGILCSMVSWFVHNQVNLTTPFGDATLYVLFGILAAARNYVQRQQDDDNKIDSLRLNRGR